MDDRKLSSLNNRGLIVLALAISTRATSNICCVYLPKFNHQISVSQYCHSNAMILVCSYKVLIVVPC